MKNTKMMKTIKSVLALVLLTLSIVNLSAQVDRTKAPVADVPEDINLGDLKTITLDNGMEVFLVPKPGYGKFVFSMSIDQPTFIAEENPECRSALSNLYYHASTANYTQEEFDSITTFLGAKVAIHNNGGHVIALRENMDQLLTMFTDFLYHPIYDEEAIAEFVAKETEKQKKKLAGDVKKNTNSELNSPLNRLKDSLLIDEKENKVPVVSEEDKDFSKVTPASVKAFHDTRLVASRTTAILMGDFSEKEARKVLNKYFAQWDAGEPFKQKAENKSNAKFLENRQIFVLENKGAVQSKISFHWSLGDLFPYSENDVPVVVMDQILGGYTRSYIYSNLREDKGLCYSAFSSVGSHASGGTGFIKTDVRTDVTALAIENIILEMLRIRNKKVSDDDLRIAKNSLIGAYARSLSGTAVQRFLGFSMVKSDYDLPDDYLKTYSTKIGAVTKEEVYEMANKYVKPNNCLIVVEGDIAGIKAQKLEQYGPVTYLDKDGKPLASEE